MVKQEYPKWIYRPGGDCKVVGDAAAHAAAGRWWHEGPLEAETALAIAMAEATGIDQPVAHMTTPEPEPEPTIAAVTAYYAAPTKVAVAKVASLDGPEALEELRVIEDQRPGGARKAIARALAERLGKLRATTLTV